MPLCSRCVAILIGLDIGLGLGLFYITKPDLPFLMVFIFSLIPISIDGLMQGFGYWESTNPVRVVTGMLPGIMSGFSLGIIYETLK